jgi:hypothetical protein
MESGCPHEKWGHRRVNDHWTECRNCFMWSVDCEKWILSDCVCNKGCPPHYCKFAQIWQHIDQLEEVVHIQQVRIADLEEKIDKLKK